MSGGTSGRKGKGRKGKSGSSNAGRRKDKAKPLPLWVLLLRAFVLTFLIVGGLGNLGPFRPWAAFALAGFYAALSLEDEWLPYAVSLSVAFTAWLSFALLGGFPKPQVLIAFVGLACVGCLAGRLVRPRVEARYITWAFLAVIVVVFLVAAVPGTVESAGKAAVEPVAEDYGFDPIFFVKVKYLMQEGTPYYDAYREGFRQDSRFDEVIPNLSGWRSPVLFWLWRISPGASPLTYVFLFLATGALVASFLLAKEVSGGLPALVAPALLASYYTTALSSWWWAELEFWAMFATLGAALAMQLDREKLSLGLSVLAASIREWLFSALGAGFIRRAAKKEWKGAIPWLAATAVVLGLYVVNFALVHQYLNGIGVTPTLGSGGLEFKPGFIIYSLRFCSEHFLNPRLIPLAVFFLSLMGAAHLIRNRDLYLPSLLFLPVLAFMVFGSGRGDIGSGPGWNDYYNAAFMPFAFILAPSFWKLLVPKGKKR